GNTYGLGQVLFKATPLIFTGLSVAFAFRAGMFNIGAEGQMNIGAFAAAWAGFTFTALPWVIHIPISICFAFAGGALWALIAGYLKARVGSHEVINTIMLNFIALALVSYLVNSVYNVPATVRTPEISPSAHIPRFDSITGFFSGSPFNMVFIIGICVCLLTGYIIRNTPLGYEIRTSGFNRDAAEYAGMNIKKLTVLSMTVAGGFAGLSGLNFVNGYKHYFELGFSEGTGYMGIAVALIARNNPIAIIPVAVFFGILEYGGLTVNTLVPKEIITIIQALTILSAITITELFRRRVSLE
ncbi:MAG: ABC transporter permease, partial [Ignavibacteria bacterium]|nr:ABC transporter permease [Ignavibacteria bacterium]